MAEDPGTHRETLHTSQILGSLAQKIVPNSTDATWIAPTGHSKTNGKFSQGIETRAPRKHNLTPKEVVSEISAGLRGLGGPGIWYYILLLTCLVVYGLGRWNRGR